jgi:BirA family biotin operon repressor/biotin-[acetyl-CoA-carboxylase] ligase
MSDLSQAALQARLALQPFQFFAVVDSTNDIAMRWLQDGAEAGSVVIADEQLKGRGRMGRTWHTPPGVALAMSVILKPPMEFANRVSMLGALAVAELCEGVGAKNVGIKYPNDVQINRRKVCGVLPEAAWENNRLVGIVLGMGVNVRVQFDEQLAQTATNLEIEARRDLNRVELIAYLLMRVESWSARIESFEFFSAWKNRLNTIGQRVTIGDVSGIAEDVDSSGALLVRTANNQMERIIAGDVLLTGE